MLVSRICVFKILKISARSARLKFQIHAMFASACCTKFKSPK
ncbi:hypothetical protein CAMGR0001_1163 [Campylobacter gracilis RM3268]|uniref:Uncharacterized protein n=1 Tax=Campylobacter gracilis RM3268 TaxID=553220 RepID=C8PIW4_9BACT|nr:hypothetical protein CAMGR0001_1163 [Campylobacter gracilis RM3268]